MNQSHISPFLCGLYFGKCKFFRIVTSHKCRKNDWITHLPLLLPPWFKETQQQSSAAAKTVRWKVQVKVVSAPDPCQWSTLARKKWTWICLIEPWTCLPGWALCKVVEHVTIREDSQIQKAGASTEQVNPFAQQTAWGRKRGNLKIQRFKRDLLHTILIALEWQWYCG